MQPRGGSSVLRPGPDRAVPLLALRLFGPFEVHVNGHPLPRLRSRNGQALLALLTLRPDGELERAWLAGVLWPDRPTDRGLALLRRDLTDLRRALGPAAPSLRSPTPHTLTLELTAAEADVVAFDQAVASGEAASLERAVALYRGPLLEGWEEREWVFQERQAREQACLGALLSLAAQAMARGEHGVAERHLRRVVAVDSLRESAQRLLMQALAAGGNTTAAMQAYQELRRRLRQELNAEPDAETRALFETLRAEARHRASAPPGTPRCQERDWPVDLPPPPPPGTAAPPLPLSLTSFVGREDQIAEVEQRRAVHRLVTLTGSGGCGKTRLALQVAAQVAERFRDGVRLVELAALSDPALIPHALMTALGLRETSGRPLTQTLVEYLQPRQLLLVLDNCEHLVEACSQWVATLLQRCAQLRMLATSRETLRAAGEVPYRVPSLSLPDPRQLPSLERLTQYEAVRLFVDRALLSQASFTVTHQNALAVAQVCQRLDGIPLAIELAAARLRALPVEQIVARLDDRFRLLTGGSRTALPRQQTLRALIDWSYDLLSPAEQGLLRRLSVFAGGWTLDAAEAVCMEERVENWEVLDLLTSLVEKSLVVYDEQAGAGRYRLFETVRQYARDRLLEAGNTAAVRGRHRDFFLALAEAAAPELRGADQLRWLDRLEGEHDNLRLALSGCQDRPEHSELELRLGGALFLFWRMRGHYTEGLAWLEAALARAPAHGPPSRARARALMGAGHLGFYQREDFAAVAARLAESAALWREIGDQRELAYTLIYLGGSTEYSARIPILEESVALARDVGDGWVLATALWQLALNVNRFLDDPDHAEALARESAALFRQVGDRWGVSGPLGLLGWIAEGRGDSRTAIAMHEEALALQREVGDPWRIGLHLGQLARYALAGGNVERAECLSQEGLAFLRTTGDRLAIIESLLDLARIAGRQDEKVQALYEDALRLAREVEDKPDLIHLLGTIGHAAREQGDYGRARGLYQESLALRREVRDIHAIAQSLEDFAGLAGRQQQWERAVRLLGAAEAVCVDLGTALPVAIAEEYWRTVSGARGALGEAAFTAAWAAGREMSLDEACAYALQERDADA